MKAIIIAYNYSYDYDTRAKYVERVLEKKGYEVEYLISDFDHRNKKTYTVERENIAYIHVPQYKKNVSAGRLYSCFVFAKQVGKFLEKKDFDLIYHLAPPNATVRELSKIKCKKSFVLITEIGDMWPESLPFSGKIESVLKPLLNVWSNLRDNYLSNSDVVIAECDLFKDLLILKSKNNKVYTFYFCKPFIGSDSNFLKSISETVSFCYLGSINNIIDIDLIELFFKSVAKRKKKSVVLHIIGDGESRRELLSRCELVGVKVIFHGMVFEDGEKKSIFEQCHFALNIMKENVCVGMTMKSLDYFSFGIPMINSVGGDIYTMVENNNLGYNISKSTVVDVVNKIISISNDEYYNLRENMRVSHERYFSETVFEEKFGMILDGGILV